jgi:2-dehydro-3-deoxygluconokinase
MTSPPTVLTFGEALVGYASVEHTLRTATQFTRFPGGADLNVAVGLTRLGIRTIWASVLGDDAHADYLADAVDQLGIIPLVRRASGPTALMFKAGGATGDPEVLQVRHDTAFARHADALLAADIIALDGIDHLHLTGITLGISPVVRAASFTLVDAAVAAGVSVSFDPNLRLDLWPDRDEMRTVINSLAAHATVVMPGLAEGRLLTGASEPDDIAEFYLRRGVPQVVIKLGAAGARCWSVDGGQFTPAPSRSPPLTRSAQATASRLGTSPPFSPAEACKKELIKVLPSARWPLLGGVILLLCRSETRSMR